MRYEKGLKEVISEILTANNVLIEEKDNGCLDAIFPVEVAKTLGTNEYVKLCFSPQIEDKDSIYVAYESDFFGSLSKLVLEKGKTSIAKYPTSDYNEEKIARLLSEKISFNNAIFRQEKQELKEISYFLFFFKYIAISDEKREGIISVLVNGLTGSTSFIDHFPDNLEEVVIFNNQSIQDFQKFIEPAYKSTLSIVRKELNELVKSLERRLNRDVVRVYQYYETLRAEVFEAIRKVVFAGEVKDNAEILDMQEQIEKREIKGPDIEKLYAKIDAIEREKRLKIQDLIMKYTLDIKLEPISVIQIITKAPIYWINIKRKLFSRLFPVSFNPILKKIDDLPCESCFAPKPPYYICDEKLHIVCNECYSNCSICGKHFCHKCYNKCPKCKENLKTPNQMC